MREHEIFQRPHAIDLHATVRKPVPESWSDELKGQATVDLLPLVDGDDLGTPGWCTGRFGRDGPEFETFCGGVNTKQSTHAALWRQGNLLHFGFEPEPSRLNATGRKLLLNAIAYIARFCADRPLVRQRSPFAPHTGERAPLDAGARLGYAGNAREIAELFAEPWRAQISALGDTAAKAFVAERRGALLEDGELLTFDAFALEQHLRLDQQTGLDQKGLDALLAMLDDAQLRTDAARLLVRMLPEGPGTGTSPNNWKFWFQSHGKALFFDADSGVWRIDQLAFDRRAPSAGLRGAARADRDAPNEPAALALAATVVAAHGGRRALQDLHTFACREGASWLLWDRDRGLFRMENHGPPPTGRVTPWVAAVYDTAADDSPVRGGGEQGRPAVSAISTWQDFLEQRLAPLLLLEPSTALRLLPQAPGDGDDRRLEVRLGGRALLPTRHLVLRVDPKSGEVHAITQRHDDSRIEREYAVVDYLQAGPLRLPGVLQPTGRRGTPLECTAPQWNPAVPDGAWTSRELVLR
jgi:hypothetical protein